MTHFCTIAPTAFLNEFAEGRPHHLLLADLVEHDIDYRIWYAEHKKRHPDTTYILDNGAFERAKAGLPMYDPNKLIEMGKAVDADYIVMSDYPGECSQKTIDSARELAPKFFEEDFGTFFCPQSEVGNLADLVDAYNWAVSLEGAHLVDIIGLSILGIPNAYGVERGNKLQRYVSRHHFLGLLEENGFLLKLQETGQKMHCLGMTDGPNEIALLKPWLQHIDSWDSSSPVWTGLNGIKYDTSPTSLFDGKFELEVDFSITQDDILPNNIELALQNLQYIDKLLGNNEPILTRF